MKLLLFILCSYFSSLSVSRKFTAEDNHLVLRVSDPCVSSDGKDVFSTIRSWDKQTGKISSYISKTNIQTKKTVNVTKLQLGVKDATPLSNNAFQNIVFFLSNRSGKNQVWYVKYLDDQISEPIQLTNYYLDIADGYNLFFTTQVYNDCDDMLCTFERDQEIEARGSNTWQVYNQSFVRHWDKWLTDKISHIFRQQLDFTQTQTTFDPKTLKSPVDTMKGNINQFGGLRSNSPVPPDGGSEQFDISHDGNSVVFTAQDRTRNESWTTGWKIYESKDGQIKHLTQSIKARTQNPMYSNDQKRIAFLAMDREGYESDRLHLEIIHKETNEIVKITDFLDQSIESYSWFDENTIRFVSVIEGVHQLFSIDVTSPQNSLKAIYQDDLYSASIPLKVHGKNFTIMLADSFVNPSELFIFREGQQLEQLVQFNDMSKFQLSQPEVFKFKNAGDTIQGWVFKPSNFNASLKYPLAYLIHGGPESPFLSSWSYRWNPQIFTSSNYAVLMINPHGSPGMGQKFTDAVIGDWGGVPYQDIMQGFYNARSFDWIDTHRACALGASYGGFMVNWIQGNTDAFQCLVTHDGVFSNLNMFYATEELWFPLAENCPLNKPGCKIYEKESRDLFFKFSPETKVDNFQTPHLVIHGSHDFRIPISEGLGLFNALQLKGVPSKFLHFTEENHWVLKPENSIKWYEEVLKWLDTYTNESEFPEGKNHTSIVNPNNQKKQMRTEFI